MTRILRWLLSGLVISALSCTAIWGQATAQISGTVKDQSGAVLPGVEITATQTGTGATRTAVTNELGSFVLPSLPLGPYRVTVAFGKPLTAEAADMATVREELLKLGEFCFNRRPSLDRHLAEACVVIITTR